VLFASLGPETTQEAWARRFETKNDALSTRDWDSQTPIRIESVAGGCVLGTGEGIPGGDFSINLYTFAPIKVHIS
jgi:hypothetical protein